MSDSRSKSLKANFMFIPRPLENVQVNKQTVKLYPIVDSSMKPPKRAHAFQTIKTALSIPGIDCRAMLATLGVQLNLRAIVDGILSDWTGHFRHNWYNFAHLTILLFHSVAGTQANDNCHVNDLIVLLPVVDGPLANYPKQVCFVRDQLNLNFAGFVPRGVQGLTILQVKFYIKLPQSSCDMMATTSCIASPPGLATLTSVPSLPPTSLVMSWPTPSRTDPSTCCTPISI